MKEADIYPLTLGDTLRYLGLWILMTTYYGWKRGDFWSVTLFDQEEIHATIGGFISKRQFNSITCELRFNNTNPPPYVYKFWKILQMVKAWNDHMTSILLDS